MVEGETLTTLVRLLCSQRLTKECQCCITKGGRLCHRILSWSVHNGEKALLSLAEFRDRLAGFEGGWDAR